MLIECANCGAPLNVAGNATVVTCNYCSRQNRVDQTRTVAPQTPAGWQPPQNWTPPNHVPAQPTPLHYHQSSARSVKYWWLIALVPVVFSIGAGIFASATGGSTGNSVLGAVPGAGNAPLGEHMQWKGGRDVPVVADIDGDGTEDVLGLYVLLNDGKSITYFGAFDGKSFERVWNTEALGSSSDNPVYAFTGGLIALTDGNNFLHILSAKDGKTAGGLQLSDKASRLCVDPENDGQVWIEQVDEAHKLLNLKTAEAKPAPRPDWCRKELSLTANRSCWGVEFQRKRKASAACKATKGLPKVDGYRAEYLLAAGDSRVSLGSKYPGTQVPMVTGYSPSEDKTLWTRKLVAPGIEASNSAPDVADLVNGKVIAMYETKPKGARLTALDAKTGKTDWDVPVPRSDAGIQADVLSVSSSRVYVPHWTWLDIFDVKTGKHLATIGKW